VLDGEVGMMREGRRRNQLGRDRGKGMEHWGRDDVTRPTSLSDR